MKCFDIRRLPTSLDMTHESVYRSYHILEKVVELLNKETPPAVILEIIEDLRSEPFSTESVNSAAQED